MQPPKLVITDKVETMICHFLQRACYKEDILSVGALIYAHCRVKWYIIIAVLFTIVV